MLACAEPGVVYERLAAELGVTTMTVGAWRKRFAQARCDGLADGRRSGRPKAELVLTDAERELAGEATVLTRRSPDVVAPLLVCRARNYRIMLLWFRDVPR